MNKYLIFFWITTGIWGIIAKLGIKNIDWKTSLTLIWGTCFVLNAIFVFPQARPDFSITTFWLIIGGVMAFIGTTCFYKFLSSSELNLISLQGLYVLIPVIFGFVFLHEGITLRKIIAIALAIISMILI